MIDPQAKTLITAALAATEKAPTTQTFPPLLLKQSVHRVRLVALILVGLIVVTWVIPGLIDGFLWYDLRSFPQWAPPVFMVLASLAMFFAARSRQIPARVILGIALVYEVAVSFGIVFSQYLGVFYDFTAEQIRFDAVGLNSTALWMLCFTVFVPVKPRHAVIGLLGSAAATPIVYALIVRAGEAPALQPGQFFWTLVFPYLVVAGLSYVIVRILYSLGQDVWRARELGSYRLEHRLGQGGMGEVWRASHRMLKRPAAVKLISPAALGDTPETLAETLARFEREAQVTAELQSQHTVKLYDYGITENGQLYYAMELLEGVDLEQLVRRFGALPPERVIHILRGACDSLAEAHRRGLVHRDIKPSNIILCQYAFNYDVVKLLDFGLAKKTQFEAQDDVRLSQAEVVRGTPAYMAPELALGSGDVDARSDIYALGCVAYWLLTGGLVFEASSPTAMIVAHVQQLAVPPGKRSETPVPPELDALVMDCLAKDPDARIPSAQALAERLSAISVDEPWSATRAEEWWSLHAPTSTAGA